MPGNCHFTTNVRTNDRTPHYIQWFYWARTTKMFNDWWEILWENNQNDHFVCYFFFFFTLFQFLFVWWLVLLRTHGTTTYRDGHSKIIIIWFENKFQIYSQRRRNKSTQKLDIEYWIMRGIVEIQSLLRWFENRNSKKLPRIH